MCAVRPLASSRHTSKSSASTPISTSAPSPSATTARSARSRSAAAQRRPRPPGVHRVTHLSACGRRRARRGQSARRSALADTATGATPGRRAQVRRFFGVISCGIEEVSTVAASRSGSMRSESIAAGPPSAAAAAASSASRPASPCFRSGGSTCRHRQAARDGEAQHLVDERAARVDRRGARRRSRPCCRGRGRGLRADGTDERLDVVSWARAPATRRESTWRAPRSTAASASTHRGGARVPTRPREEEQHPREEAVARREVCDARRRRKGSVDPRRHLPGLKRLLAGRQAAGTTASATSPSSGGSDASAARRAA